MYIPMIYGKILEVSRKFSAIVNSWDEGKCFETGAGYPSVTMKS